MINTGALRDYSISEVLSPHLPTQDSKFTKFTQVDMQTSKKKKVNEKGFHFLDFAE